MFELAYPWALVLLLLPFLIWFVAPKAKIQLPAALKIPFFEAISKIVDFEKHSLSSTSVFLFPVLIWILLICALSGPRWVGEPMPVNHEGYNIMMVLDLSNSMNTEDMIMQGRPMSRLAVVKRAASQFVQDRVGDRIGLILFGSRAYLQTPLTYDRHSVLMRIEDATAGLAGPMTAIGDGVGLAVKRLEDVPNTGRIIILLTDGVDNAGVLRPLKAAELAKDDGIKIYTIGLGAESDPNVLSNDAFIPNSYADLDEKTLKKMATSTGGLYFRATDTETLHSIYKTINELETTSQPQASIRPQKEYYPWLVASALLLCLLWLGQKMNLPFQTRRIARDG